jgi:hypothetical protein
MQKDLKDRFKAHKELIKDVVKDSTNDNDSDVTNLITADRVKYIDRNTRLAVYIENEVAQAFDDICKDKKGLKSEIVNRLLKDFLDKVQAKNEVPEWDIPNK